MILVDANLLVYAYVEESPHHEPARDWLEQQRQQHALRAEAALAELARLPLPWD